jgi:hypothetical protein
LIDHQPDSNYCFSGFLSLTLYLLSTIPRQNKRSLPRITTKMQKSQTEIPAVPLETLKTLQAPLLELLGRWEAAASVYRTLNVR